MERSQLIISLYEEESNRLMNLSEDGFGLKAKKGSENEWKISSEKLDILNQMIEETPMHEFKHNEETGLTRQVFIGIIEDKPELFYKTEDSINRDYYIKITIKNFGDEHYYKDERLLKLSSGIWSNWFLSYKYFIQKEKRLAENKKIYVEAVVIGGEIKKLRWFNGQ